MTDPDDENRARNDGFASMAILALTIVMITFVVTRII